MNFVCPHQGPIGLTAAEEVNTYSNLSHRTPWCERPSSEHPARTWWQPTHQGLPRSLVHRSPGLPGPSTSGPCHEDKWEKESFWCLTSSHHQICHTRNEIGGLPWCIMVQFPQESHPINCILHIKSHQYKKSSRTSSYCLYASACCRNTFFHLPRISHLQCFYILFTPPSALTRKIP